MPNSENAKRSLRKVLARKERNRPARSALRTHVKKVRTISAAGATSDAQSALQLAIKKLDQSAAKGLIHKNKASRLKSRLTLLVNKVAAAGGAAPAASSN